MWNDLVTLTHRMANRAGAVTARRVQQNTHLTIVFISKCNSRIEGGALLATSGAEGTAGGAGGAAASRGRRGYRSLLRAFSLGDSSFGFLCLLRTDSFFRLGVGDGEVEGASVLGMRGMGGSLSTRDLWWRGALGGESGGAGADGAAGGRVRRGSLRRAEFTMAGLTGAMRVDGGLLLPTETGRGRGATYTQFH